MQTLHRLTIMANMPECQCQDLPVDSSGAVDDALATVHRNSGLSPLLGQFCRARRDLGSV